MTLSNAQGRVLVQIAREEVSAWLGVAKRVPRDEEWLMRDRATFVTITAEGKLKGCIGSLIARVPLADDVRRNAVAAATRDTRFAPLNAAELDSVRFEVSVLTPMARLEVDSEGDLISKLTPGVDGLYLRDGIRSSTFLPQVWESLPDPRDFLSRLRIKAGLPSSYWNESLEFSTYQVQKFKED